MVSFILPFCEFLLGDNVVIVVIRVLSPDGLWDFVFAYNFDRFEYKYLCQIQLWIQAFFTHLGKRTEGPLDLKILGLLKAIVGKFVPFELLIRPLLIFHTLVHLRSIFEA